MSALVSLAAVIAFSESRTAVTFGLTSCPGMSKASRVPDRGVLGEGRQRRPSKEAMRGPRRCREKRSGKKVIRVALKRCRHRIRRSLFLGHVCLDAQTHSGSWLLSGVSMEPNQGMAHVDLPWSVQLSITSAEFSNELNFSLHETGAT